MTNFSGFLTIKSTFVASNRVCIFLNSRKVLLTSLLFILYLIEFEAIYSFYNFFFSEFAQILKESIFNTLNFDGNLIWRICPKLPNYHRWKILIKSAERNSHVSKAIK